MSELPATLLLSRTGVATALPSRTFELAGFRVMENYAQGMAASGPDATDAVTEVDPVDAARPLDWPLVHREYYGVPLRERTTISILS